MKPELYVFAKRPDMGRAKTRLAHDIGVTHAQRHARAMMARVLRQVRDPRWDTIVYAAPQRAIGQEPLWLGLPQIGQPKGSLTPRLAKAFSGSRRPVIVIGTDCPQVEARDIADALKALRRADLVFGPASDGGFWLMAAMAPLGPEAFENVPWSTDRTLAVLQEQLDGRVACLRTLTDVDDGPSLRLIRSARHSSR